ncbi:hypothetical protein JCM11491_003328 [Sporobolomyces phaffii]
MNYDNAWPPGPGKEYPPLPPPTRDETAFLEEIAALGQEWPQIMNERALRAEAIENRISNARLEASLPRFESFDLDNPHPPSTNAPPFTGVAGGDHFYNSSHHIFPEPMLARPPLPASFDHNSSTQLASRFPPPNELPQPFTSFDRHEHTIVGDARSQEERSAQNRFTEDNRGNWRTDPGFDNPHQVQATESQLRHAHWWEEQIPPAQVPEPFQPRSQPVYQHVEFEARPVQQRPLGGPSLAQPLYHHQQAVPSAHHQAPPEHQPYATQYRPFHPPLPPPLSQLPYHQPSREWNQALPLPLPPREYTAFAQDAQPPRHYHETSTSSSGELHDPLPTGLTYATSATSPSTDRSRHSSTNFYSGYSDSTDQIASTAVTSSTGAGKRTRFDSWNYSRPSLAVQPHVAGTPSSSSQQTSSSSSSLPTTASFDNNSLPPVSPDLPLPKPVPSSSNPNPVIAPGNRRGNKTKVDVPVSCVTCGDPIARLILRGQKHELEVPYEAVFRCLNCASPGALGGSIDDVSPSTHGERSPSVDSPPVPPSRRTSVASNPNSNSTGGTTPTIPTTFRKKTKRLDVGQATLTACDVCLMDRATGSVLPREPEKGYSINFQIEVVCASCDRKYQRCSDCGGGGGVRLGTGKYRSKELFKDGKKTCSLRHQRLGAFPEMEYQVWRNTDLPKDELEEVSEKCGELFANQMLGAIAIPEVLERNGAIWTSFAEAQSHAYSGWRGMDPMIRYNVEPSQGIRRYLALRLCAPNLRKTTRKADMPVPVEAPRTGQIFKGDKEIVGYIIAEWDMKRGVLFLALVIPWDATGEAYDATTLLLQALCTRVQRDHKEENQSRAERSEPLLPKLERVFTMLFFKTGSRMITQLTKKRGFAPIDEYLAANPRADPLAFPPHRPIYLPNERQQGWLVLVRTLRGDADGSVDDWSARRSADEERGKRKEARAKLAREKKAREEDLRGFD